MRGKLAADPTAPLRERNIPAYAGKTWLLANSPVSLTEHPRVCGENKTFHFVVLASVGTSPRMRGKPSIAARLTKNGLEHPRVCGENDVNLVTFVDPNGTSPRMRGKPPPQTASSDMHRNIPAYAGKTSRKTRCIHTAPEHPRVCGENLTASLYIACNSGTSPRMRGKP